MGKWNHANNNQSDFAEKVVEQLAISLSLSLFSPFVCYFYMQPLMEEAFLCTEIIEVD